ncbi:MAG: HypC/HybG/HupF family hydrogenase formation chaperone [Acidimicrobiia bacterium]|nr:HypC/HybG/HupF family hydrogenase formation chaperone [Acidimicrobiia bacterium]
MCLAVPTEVVEIRDDDPDVAVVEVSGVRRAINIGLLTTEGVQPGDWVLVHVGFAMSKIDEAEARATLRLLEELGQAYDDELQAMAEGVD